MKFATEQLDSLEDLEKAVEGSGLAWEDYKTTIRNSLLTQEVIRREVGSRIDIGNDEVKKYYDAHPQEFKRPEQVVLSEIFLSTEGKSPEEIESVQKKAEDLRNRVMKGDDFSEIAKRYSEGSTAKDRRESWAPFNAVSSRRKLEEVVFKMEKGQITDVIQTKTGFRNPQGGESLPGRVAADGQSGKRNHEPAIHAENGAADARISGPAARRELCDGEARIHGHRRSGRGHVIHGSAAHARRGAEEEEKKKVPLPKVNGQ